MSDIDSYVSILDRDKPRPIIVTPMTIPEKVLPIIVLIILIIFVGWMLYLLFSSNFDTTPVPSNTLIPCPPNSCATDLVSGFKTCPTGTNIVYRDPANAVCNNPSVCDNPITPYAVQSDGSTNLYGVCEGNTICPCLRSMQCPSYVLSVFTTDNGNPYEDFSGQRITFPQITDEPPITLTDPSLNFCFAPLSWLPYSTPGCNFISDPNSITYQQIVTCMGAVNGCNGVDFSPCLQGVLALVSNNPESLTQQNITASLFGCVAGNTCPCGTIAIFDTNTESIICKNLPG